MWSTTQDRAGRLHAYTEQGALLALTPGGRWSTLVAAEDGPGPRTHGSLVYDNDGLLLLGGRGASARPLKDQWRFREGVWGKLRAPGGPPPRCRAHVVSYGAGQGVLLVGGEMVGRTLTDVWRRHDGVWEQVGTLAEGEAVRGLFVVDEVPYLVTDSPKKAPYGQLYRFNGSGLRRVMVLPPPPRAVPGPSHFGYDSATGSLVRVDGGRIAWVRLSSLLGETAQAAPAAPPRRRVPAKVVAVAPAVRTRKKSSS